MQTQLSHVPPPPPHRLATQHADVQKYFEYSHSGVDVVADGLEEIRFGEFLVTKGAVDRFQLFRAIQMQDRLPGVRLGEAAAALGFVPIKQVEQLYAEFARLHTVDVG